MTSTHHCAGFGFGLFVQLRRTHLPSFDCGMVIVTTPKFLFLSGNNHFYYSNHGPINQLGLGNPLVGPSAVDAVVAGCVYINPTYKRPTKDVYWSQHPFVRLIEEASRIS